MSGGARTDEAGNRQFSKMLSRNCVDGGLRVDFTLGSWFVNGCFFYLKVFLRVRLKVVFHPKKYTQRCCFRMLSEDCVFQVSQILQ